MNQRRSKKIRKELIAAGLKGDDLEKAYRAAKKQKAIDWLKANIPKAPE